MTPTQRVQAMYEAFGRGDVPAIVSQFADDIDWEYGALSNDVPWLQHRRGRQEATKFFASLSALDITQFEPRHFLASGNLVVCLIDVAFTVKATGRKVQEPEEVHIWHFNDAGQVVRFRHRVDTWASVAAHRDIA